jgi:hypothetical protein
VLCVRVCEPTNSSQLNGGMHSASLAEALSSSIPPKHITRWIAPRSCTTSGSSLIDDDDDDDAPSVPSAVSATRSRALRLACT